MSKIAKEVADKFRRLVSFNKAGKELPDPRPMEVPAHMRLPEDIHTRMRRMIREDMSAYAESQGAESFDDANDFEVEDEEPESRATHHELHEEVVNETRRVREEQTKAANSRRADAEEESRRRAEAPREDAEEEADTSRSRSHVKRKSQARSPQRSSNDEREDAQSEVDRRVSRRGLVDHSDE